MISEITIENPILCDGWRVFELPVADSTNLVAAKLSAWEAVRADRQTAGRGRFQRGWVSDGGGLWLSAVVPTGPKTADWRALPLAVGLAVCDALRSIGVSGFRVRWPNDILVGNRKLAGLLIEQFAPGLAVAGIGINVFNQPETSDAELKGQIARLVDLVPAPPDLRQLTRLVLASLRGVVDQMHTGGFAVLLPRVNELWGAPRKVELDLDGEIRRGIFGGVGRGGELLLVCDSGPEIAFHSHQVRHLKEVD